MLQRLAVFLRGPGAPSLVATARCVSSGSVNITAPLNFWAGKRRGGKERSTGENVYEPATGNARNYLTLKTLFVL